MIRYVVSIVFVIIVLHCVSSAPVAAQQNGTCIVQYQWCAICGDPLLPGTIDCVPEITFISVCTVVSSNCAPTAAPQETCPGCGGAAGSAAAGKPINLAYGNTFIAQRDIRVAGLSGGLTLLRTWNSMWPSTQTAFQVGLFGPNWRSNFEERVFVGDDNFVKYARGDGSFWSFGYSGGSLTVAAPANVAATLVQGASYWTLTFQNGEQRLFDVARGNLIEVIDRNGNATQLSYDALGRLVTVTDPVSRHLYFSYASGSSYLVTSVTSDIGLAVSYSYDTQGRLSLITEPDQSTLSFQYNSQSLITAVTDTNGNLLESHTYDSSGRGLTSSRANGVDAVTVTYPN